MAAWLSLHQVLVLCFIWPVVSALCSLAYTKLDEYPRAHAFLSALAAAGLDLPKLLVMVRRLLTPPPP